MLSEGQRRQPFVSAWNVEDVSASHAQKHVTALQLSSAWLAYMAA